MMTQQEYVKAVRDELLAAERRITTLKSEGYTHAQMRDAQSTRNILNREYRWQEEHGLTYVLGPDSR